MELRQRLERILKETLSLQEELRLLRAREAELQNRVEMLEKALSEEKSARHQLEEQNKIAKIATVYELERTDKTALKRIINQYVKEIDRCITLLNEQ